MKIYIYLLSCLGLAFYLNGCGNDDTISNKFHKTCCEEPSTQACHADEVCIYIPNTFSPNGDGINDLFYVQSSMNSPSIRTSLAISDEGGNIVFSKVDVPANDPSEAWDGIGLGNLITYGAYQYMAIITWPDQSSNYYLGTIYLRTGSPITCIENEYNCEYSTQFDGIEHDPTVPSLEHTPPSPCF